MIPYNLFVKKYRPIVSEDYPEIEGLHVLKEVGRLWNDISDAEMSLFKDLAKKDLSRYHTEHK